MFPVILISMYRLRKYLSTYVTETAKRQFDHIASCKFDRSIGHCDY